MGRQLVILGAARSGTKIIRDVLAEATGSGAVPYDVGFVWRYGNEQISHDQLDPASANPKIARFIRRYLGRYASKETGMVIEKTVGNTLRVPFVRSVLPNASFIHLVRDGVDVAESARRQWLAPPDLRYLARKVPHFPARLVPTYGRKYVASLASRYRNDESRVGTWGPRYPQIDEDVRTEPLLTVCARQWQRSVNETRLNLGQLELPHIEIRYEQLIANPRGTLETALDYLELSARRDRLERAVSMVKPGRTGTGARSLSPDELESLDQEVGSTLEDLDYDFATARGGASGRK